MPDRRFPPPWTVEDNGAAFIVKDRAGRDALRRISRGHAAMSGRCPVSREGKRTLRKRCQMSAFDPDYRLRLSLPHRLVQPTDCFTAKAKRCNREVKACHGDKFFWVAIQKFVRQLDE